MSFLLLIAWGVHWHTFSSLELGLDGALSVDLARSPLGDMLAFNARDVHPPLFYALLQGWLWLTGAHYLPAKYLAIAASLPALPLLYQLGRRLISAWASGLAALLLAVAPASLYLAPTVRDFSLGLTLSLATVVVTLDLSVHPPPPRHQTIRLLLLALLTLAALLTWYFHLFVLVTEALVLLYARRRIVAAHAVLAAGCLLASPWYLYVVPHITGKLAGGTTTFGDAPQLPNALDLANGITRALFGEPWSGRTAMAAGGWLLTLVLGLLAAGPVRRRRGGRSAALSTERRGVPTAERLLHLALLLGIAEIALTTLRWSDVGSLSRYVLPLLPYTALLQARALAAPRLWWRLIAFVGLLLSLPVQLFWFQSLVTGAPIDWSHDQALAYVAAHAAPGDAIVFNDRARRGRYLLDGGPLPAAVVHSAGQAYLADSAAQADRIVEALVPTAQRIWLVENTPSVDVAQRALATRAFGLPAVNIGGSDVQLFLSGGSAPLRPVAATFGDLIALDAARAPSSAIPGAAMPIELVWRDIRPSAVSYTVFLHLNDSAGKTVAQHDSPPVLGFSTSNTWPAGEVTDDRFGLLLPRDLPAGDYTLQVGLYVGSIRLTLPDGANLVNLGRLHVGT